MKGLLGIAVAAIPFALIGAIDWPGWLIAWALCFVVGIACIVWQIADWSRW
jgi:hypothetical protein